MMPQKLTHENYHYLPSPSQKLGGQVCDVVHMDLPPRLLKIPFQVIQRKQRHVLPLREPPFIIVLHHLLVLNVHLRQQNDIHHPHQHLDDGSASFRINSLFQLSPQVLVYFVTDGLEHVVEFALLSEFAGDRLLNQSRDLFVVGAVKQIRNVETVVQTGGHVLHPDGLHSLELFEDGLFGVGPLWLDFLQNQQCVVIHHKAYQVQVVFVQTVVVADLLEFGHEIRYQIHFLEISETFAVLKGQGIFKA